MISYDLFMAPLEKIYLSKIRKNLIAKAKGKVLEIGFGNGANMKYYDFDKVKELHALDVNENMKQFKNVHYHILSAENLPFKDKSFDTIVLTLALCSIPDKEKAIQEIKRVLNDDGTYLFIEHELPKGKIKQRIFKLINPIWRSLTKGCQITLQTHQDIIQAGFKIDEDIISVFHFGSAIE